MGKNLTSEQQMQLRETLEKFPSVLATKPFLQQTDHKALKRLQQFKEKNTHLIRWSLSLQPFNFTVNHRKGSDNANADALSRLPHFMQKKEEGVWQKDELADHFS